MQIVSTLRTLLKTPRFDHLAPSAMALLLLLQLRTKPNNNPFTNPALFFLFSKSSSSSSLRDLKHTLKHQQSESQSQSQSQYPSTPSEQSSSFTNTHYHQQQQQQQHQQQQKNSLHDIRGTLSEFRRRTAAETLPDESLSFSDIYDRTVRRKTPFPDMESSGTAHGGGRRPFNLGAVRDDLRKPGEARARDRRRADSFSLEAYREVLRSRPLDSSATAAAGASSPENVVGTASWLPDSVLKQKRRKEESEFMKVYSFGELGEKLKKLRPEGMRKEWFSIEELNERLKRMREKEVEEAESNVTGGVLFKDMRECLVSEDEKSRKSSLQKSDILSQLIGTPAYYSDPRKEHLVEKYFHPDNMSSEEKLKIELAKVRDEFKMSESDCGSARVQVAQLTTKIKHLSAVLHKKDVHSRKGLIAMVQRRKRLLKYLRRTDWESYCFVISKLGLRDNPDHGRKT
ncbi:uncharacterized protein LOC107619746 isoform X1 [Arachis ipaensis]|uniref:Small ribosomal subunit protein uS15c n=1 Tax=Arachis hypogaea TaxID=3818 RepID=A0A6B9V2M8_ARAHY|nr:uncharacterized protein LOC107619746 isoform X1 [Arachis ipaensis]XP_016177522.2 uncharacterized protein LOC107619746 isoform X1 [Arachis ipaensis]XP_025677845.1 uncharacterized protein LOC112777662 [Arachis hypogaea]QHN75606.1 30S ribosomal protein [Arachis hypogaea]